MRHHWTRLMVASGAMILAVGCGGGGGYGGGATGPTTTQTPPAGGSTSTNISVVDNAFRPAATTVPVGSAVTWTWNGAVQHNVTFDDGTASPTQGSGTFVRTFTQAGTYAYHCTIHGVAMSGKVTVQ
ncbi:MAG TPA: plastocyanin/azurin family copper-binding protein [Gemmatimonadaceae bacterium]|nr:plastocyanin/azurin family copper-binding protein [Gemmatimonadaceae bacterium]